MGPEHQKVKNLLDEIAELQDRILELRKMTDEKQPSGKMVWEHEIGLKSIFEKSPIAAAIVRGDKRLYANHAYIKMFGYNYKSELEGVSLLKQFAPQCREVVIERIRNKDIGEPIPSSFDTYGQKTDGTQFPININEIEIHLSDGPVSVIFLTDISDRKQAEQKIHHLASFPELDPKPVLEVDFTGNPTFYNRAARDVLTQLGLQDARIFLPDDILDIVNALQLTYQGSVYREVGIKDRLFSEDICLANEFKTIRIYADDISERRKAERALQESEQNYRELVENQGEGIAIVNEQENFIFVNPAGAQIFGTLQQNIIGHKLNEFIKPEDYMTVLQETNKRKKGEKSTYEHEIIQPTGKKRYILITATPRFNKNGNFIGTLAIFRDITDLKTTLEQLKKSYDQMRRTLEETINALSTALGKRDPYTLSHQQRVTKLACAIANEMNFTYEQIEGIRVAGLLHDIGKIYIPAEILTKPAKLTGPELEIIKIHPQAGYEIVQGIEFPWPVAKIILQHHEKLNGSGYPTGIKGDLILDEAKILTVADVVEAMSSDRPYRPALGLSLALNDVLENSGVLYDKEIVDTCVALFREKDFNFS